MTEFHKIQLQTTSILKVPLQSYSKDFTFIVNGEEFQTSRIFSDLLSTNICDIHLMDPTFNTFIINTQKSGHFSYILSLFNFDQIDIPEDEIPFILEVISILGNESITYFYKKQSTELTIDNIFSLIQNHTKYHNFFEKQLSNEMDFAASKFDELLQTQKDEFRKLSISTIDDIISNQNLHLENEDQLLTLINELYENDRRYSILYERIIFSNVSEESMVNFIDLFYFNDLTGEMWNRLSQRLIQKVQNEEYKNESKRYKTENKKEENRIKFQLKNNEFNGIINFIKSQGNVENELNITASSCWDNYNNYRLHPKNIIEFDNNNVGFASNAIPCTSVISEIALKAVPEIEWPIENNDCREKLN